MLLVLSLSLPADSNSILVLARGKIDFAHLRMPRFPRIILPNLTYTPIEHSEETPS